MVELHTEEQLRRILKNVEKIFKELEFVEIGAKRIEEVKVGQLREFWIGYPLFGMVVKEEWEGLFLIVPFTIDVEFAHKTAPFIVLENKLTLLAGFPFWVYTTQKFLERCSVVVEEVSKEEVEKVLNWVEDFRLEELEEIQGKYVQALMQVFAGVNTGSLLQGLLELEEAYEKELGIKNLKGGEI